MKPLDRRSQDAVDASRAGGVALADYFAAGGQPQAIAAPYRLNDGEFCVAGVQGTVYQWLEGDGSYTTRTVMFGGVVGMAVGLGASAVGNSIAKSRAAARAAVAWRPVEQAWVSLTNQRVVIHGSSWWDLWHEHLNMVRCDGLGVELHQSGIPALRLEIPGPDWFTVMLHKVAWDQVVHPPRPDGPSALGR